MLLLLLDSLYTAIFDKRDFFFHKFYGWGRGLCIQDVRSFMATLFAPE